MLPSDSVANLARESMHGTNCVGRYQQVRAGRLTRKHPGEAEAQIHTVVSRGMWKRQVKRSRYT